MISLTTLSLTVLTQRNFVADFLPQKCNFKRKTAVLLGVCFQFPVQDNYLGTVCNQPATKGQLNFPSLRVQ